MKVRKMRVDKKCWELAKHFLSEVVGTTPEDETELAESIQALCEGFCQAIEESESAAAALSSESR
jgi:hypothetical protein